MAIAKGQRIVADDVLALLNGIFPSGSIIPFGGSSAPVGWYACTHVTVSKKAEPNLFAVIGYKYGGSGDTFYTPDMSSVVLPTEYSKTVSVSMSVAIKGNGKTLGLTDGSSNFGIFVNTSMVPRTGSYGDNVGNYNDSGSGPSKNCVVGVTTDASKSGLTGSGSGSGSFSLSYFKPSIWIIKA